MKIGDCYKKKYQSRPIHSFFFQLNKSLGIFLKKKNFALLQTIIKGLELVCNNILITDQDLCKSALEQKKLKHLTHIFWIYMPIEEYQLIFQFLFKKKKNIKTTCSFDGNEAATLTNLTKV